MKMWIGKGNTTTLLFSVNGLDILHQERRGHMNTKSMENFNKQHAYQSINVKVPSTSPPQEDDFKLWVSIQRFSGQG